MVVEEAAVEPGHLLEADAPAAGHGGEQIAGQLGEGARLVEGLLHHAGEHAVGQQAHILGEHAEDQPVHEMRHRLRRMAAPAQALGQAGEGGGGALGERLAGFAGPQPLRLRHRPFEPGAHRGIGEIFEGEPVADADAVGPVGADAEAGHVGDDQQRRILQGQRVLAQLIEGGIEIGVAALVFPGEAMAFPDIRPALAAAILAGAALEAIGFAGGVGLGGRGLAQQAAEIDEVFLAGGTLLQLRRPPFGDEGGGGHGVADGHGGVNC